MLASRPSGAEAQLSFAALADLLEDALEEALPALPAPQRRALEVALLLAEAEGPPPEQRAIAVAFLGVLRTLAGRGPIVLAVDDVQWLDAPSSLALEFAVRRLRQEPVLLLLARRVERDEAAPLGLERASLPLTRLPIGPLGLDELHRLLRLHLGASFSRPVLHRLHQTSGGNPFFALELGRALQRGGPEPAAGEDLPVPGTLRDLVADRLGALPPETEAPLLAAALLSDPTEALVEATLGADAAEGLRLAEEARVVVLNGGRIRFTHPLLDAAVRARSGAGRRRAMHRRLAGVVESEEEHARHLARAASRPAEDVAQALDRAAELAAARGAPDIAAQLVEEALRLTPPDAREVRTERMVAAGLHHLTAGNTHQGGRLLEQARGRLPAGRARARVLLALMHVVGNDTGLAVELLEQALAEAEEDRALRVEILGALGVVVGLGAADLRRGSEYAREALRLATDQGPELLHVAAAYLAWLDALQGRPIGDLLRDVGAADEEPAHLTLYWRFDTIRAVQRMWRGELEEARVQLERLRLRAIERGNEESRSGIALHLAELEWRAGNWVSAQEYAAELEWFAEEAASELAAARYCRALLEAHSGDLESARLHAEEGLRRAEATGDHAFLGQNSWVLGFVALSAGELDAVVAQLEPTWALIRRWGLGEPGVCPFVPDLVEALVALGRLGEAAEPLGWLERCAAEQSHRWALAVAARCRGLELAARGDSERALASFGAALRAHEKLRSPFERARTLLSLGASERRAKHRRAAREALESALAVFEELGAEVWAARARSELARVGGRAPSHDRGLTPTEQRISELVAEGKSNKEVAAALFVTIRTVEANLTRIYSKLGVRSRAELARTLR